MNILLTNDDGIDSEGIHKLADALRSGGNTGGNAGGKNRVFIIAPDRNRSGISNALSILFDPVELFPQGEDTWSCSGTPGDCVIIGLKGGLPFLPDLVLSGINMGANLGTDLIYSGTAAAARQASLYGIPAIALSLAGKKSLHWDMAASWSVEHLDELLKYWRKNAFVNVNIPNIQGGPIGIRTAWPALKDYRDKMTSSFSSRGNRLFQLEAGEEVAEKENGSDCDIISQNYATISTLYNYPAVFRDLCPGAPNHAAVAMREG